MKLFDLENKFRKPMVSEETAKYIIKHGIRKFENFEVFIIIEGKGAYFPADIEIDYENERVIIEGKLL